MASTIFLLLCAGVSVPAFFFPDFRDAVTGIGPGRRWWQPLTGIFVHGWPGFPWVLHLALNTVLVVECGWPCERLLGTPRFVVLSAAAMVTGAVASALSDGVNGSSLVIWAWGPSLFVALRATRNDDSSGEARRRLAGILLIMYVAVTLAMVLLPYKLGYHYGFLYALVSGNRFHLIATATGCVFALAWKRFISRRLQTFALRDSP